jgi:hypothetical protein
MLVRVGYLNKNEEQAMKHVEDGMDDYVNPDKKRIDDMVLSMLPGRDIIKRSEGGSSRRRHNKAWSKLRHEEVC